MWEGLLNLHARAQFVSLFINVAASLTWEEEKNKASGEILLVVWFSWVDSQPPRRHAHLLSLQLVTLEKAPVLEGQLVPGSRSVKVRPALCPLPPTPGWGWGRLCWGEVILTLGTH